MKEDEKIHFDYVVIFGHICTFLSSFVALMVLATGAHVKNEVQWKLKRTLRRRVSACSLVDEPWWQVDGLMDITSPFLLSICCCNESKK
jgi:hypothetical protein